MVNIVNSKKSLPTLEEEFYQISPEIIGSFPKYRLPLALFRYNETVGQLQVYSEREQRLSNEQVEEIQELCKTGELFVSRQDYPIYSKHIIKQLDLILLDKNLKPAEIAYICAQALQMRLNNYLEQPVKAMSEMLLKDILVFTEYLQGDLGRLKFFFPQIDRKDSLVSHSFNTLIIGLWLFLNLKKRNPYARKWTEWLWPCCCMMWE